MSMYGTLSNYGFIRDAVPVDLLQLLRDEVANIDITENKFNRNLAGNIESEYKLSKNIVELEQYLQLLCKQYAENWDNTNTGRDLTADNLELYAYWVNLQKKNEFNPMHTHDGTYSFVIWLTIPYNIADEIALPSASNSNMPRAGMFSFIYSNIFGEIREAAFPVDRTFEGHIFVFPSCLQHMVYPFKSSNNTRISISGNLRKRI